MSHIKVGVLGYPVKHSKSPLIHQHWINQYNKDGSYHLFEVHYKKFDLFDNQMKEENWNGFNVTVPYKQKIMNYCDEISDVALQIGAVNSVTIKNNKLYGTNTDAFGFIQNIKEEVPTFNFQKSTVMLMGAGGATRAAIYGLIQENVSKIIISNRTKEKAEQIQKINPERIEIVNWEEKEDYLPKVSLLVNTTSLGMQGQDKLLISIDNLPNHAIVHDIVYAPLMTDLLLKAQKRNLCIITGIGMLLHQARPSFESWFGIYPDVTDDLKQKVLR